MRLLGFISVARMAATFMSLVMVAAMGYIIYHVFPPARELMDVLYHAVRAVLAYLNHHLKGWT